MAIPTRIQVRIVLSTVIKVTALLLGLIGVLLILGGMTTVPDTLRHGREINQSFASASSWVASFSREHGRLPSSWEFKRWAAVKEPKQPFGVSSIEIVRPSTLPAEVVASFGHPVASGYVLSLWRGEWFEYYASWRQASTVDTSKTLYYVTYGGGLGLAIIGLLLWWIGGRVSLRGVLQDASK